ncbi:LptF/LptG family permease [Pleurocapsales cyanobacterium LEGE 10410]|nr:LptF/LptG family permease [Pleurocapsales cyanobacterium LEGE 10410]
MDRYLIKELAWFFLFSVGLLSSLGVSIGTVSDLGYKITEYKLPIPVAILIFAYKIPEYVAYALPISILLTSLIIYGRLNSDRELVALLSIGISFYRIVLPALIFSLIITGITFLLNELIVPAANYQASLLQNPYIAETELNLQKRDVFYIEYKSTVDDSAQLKNIYFAERYYQQSLQQVTIISFNRGNISQIITAKSARWNRQRQVWDLVAGKINRFDEAKATNTLEEFTKKQLPLSDTIFKIAQKKRSLEEMNIRQAKEYLRLIEDSGKPIDLAKLTVRIQQKYAFPFICIVFIIIGSALGAKYSQINRSKSFGLCVAIVFLYYLLAFVIGSLGITGILSPWVAAWLPNLVGLTFGGYLIFSVND